MKGSVKLPVFIDDARKYVNTTQLRAKYLGASYEAEYCQWQALHGLGSLMETASLIITPNAYLEGKLIASYPPDPIGDMSVTRATTATRVNSAGLVELVPYNLLTYSQNFTIGWSASPIGTITSSANFGIAPDGTTTSTRIIFTGASQIYRKTISGITGTTGVFSLWIKGTAGETITITYGGGSDKLVTLGDGWNRFNTDGNVAAINDIYINTFLSATARDIEVWGGQVNEGSTAKDYQKTETRLNIPRLDYSNGTCPSLLVEPQRTNIALRSEQFDNATWVKTNTTITANQIASPDGNTNADLLQSTLSTEPRIRQTTTQTVSAAFTFSCFAKKGNVNFLILRNLAVNSAGGSRAWFNLDTGIVGTVNAGLTASMVSYGNGWYRCTINGTTDAVPTNLVDISLSEIDNSISGAPIGSNILIWGAQLEAGSYPTSYIPTTSASVTRNADVISKTGISSLIGQTEGTLFFECSSKAFPVSQYLVISDGTGNNRINIYQSDNNNLGVLVRTSSTTVVNITNVLLPSTGTIKIALGYANNDFVLYLNGNQVGTDTSGAIPLTNSLILGGNADFTTSAGNQNFNAAALWKTRLTNDQLTALTTI